MKKVINSSFSLLIIASLFQSAFSQEKNDPILMTIGTDKKVPVSEFLNVYNKNSSIEQGGEKESMQKYLELFTNFKLKVKEAEELQLDTATSFKEELKGYRKQLAQPYLTDKDVNEKLLKEAYDRLKTDVKASHILIKLSDNALPKDTLEAYNKILKIRERIIKGEDFGKVAKETSQDPSAKDNAGDLGYFTAMQMVYPFESAAYKAKIGEVTMPVRTRFGYHILKVQDKRNAQGEILVSHIMVKTTEKMSQEDSLKAKSKVEEIYQKAKAGDNFVDLAKNYSDDKGSAAKGGELPWFGTNRMPLEFEQAAFALKNNGDISEPMRTKYGWHIIKRIDKKDIQAFDAMKNELKNKISKDSRAQAGRSSLIAKLKKEYKFKEVIKTRDEFYKTIDTTFFEGKWTLEKAKNLNKTMFSLLDKNYTQADFAKFIESHQTRKAKTDVKVAVDNLYNQFVDESVVAFEDARLEEKNPEFKALMQEYREGILLFEITDRKVWSKAVKDTTGLKEFYEKNKSNTKYFWDERADATIYTCADDKIAKKVRAMIKKNKSEKEITDVVNKTSQLNLQTESKYFVKGENNLVDANWNPSTSADKVSEDKKVQFVVVKRLIKPEPKPLSDIKGIVTADYQNTLEKEWIDSLKNKYKVQVNQDVFNSINK